MALASGCGKITEVIDMQFQAVSIIVWISASAALGVATYRAGSYYRRRNRNKAARVFEELRQMGYDIYDINSSSTRARLRHMDPRTEQWIYSWVDIIELGRGYGLADPINSEQ